MKKQRGFTLLEVVVVIGIVSLLAGLVMFNAARGNAQSRDVDRQADLRTMQAAIELYKQKYGRYPARCGNRDTSQSWSGQLGTQYDCADGSGQYIVGLAPEFIPVLPVDPKLNGADSGYVYTVNSAGTVYKLAARKTVETETVTYSHPLKSCDADNTSKDTSQASFYTTAPICNKVFSVGTVSGRKPEWCKTNDTTNTFQISYAVWGGFAAGSGITVGSSADLTEDIICI